MSTTYILPTDGEPFHPRDLVTLQAAAAQSGLSVATIRYHATAGHLRVERFRPGRERFTTQVWLSAFLASYPGKRRPPA